MTHRAIHSHTKREQSQAAEDIKSAAGKSLHFDTKVHEAQVSRMQNSCDTLHSRTVLITCANKSPIRNPKKDVALLTRMGLSSRALM